jgi:5-methylcytosine-specific restriction endonuclease McrA
MSSYTKAQYEKNKDTLIQKSKEYYYKHQDIMRVKALERYHSLTPEQLQRRNEQRKKRYEERKKLGIVIVRKRYAGKNSVAERRKEIFTILGLKCKNCGLENKPISFYDIDHITPVRVVNEHKLKYSDINNLQILCPNCHREKTLSDMKLYPQRRQRVKQTNETGQSDKHRPNNLNRCR